MNHEPITRSFFHIRPQERVFTAVCPLTAMRGLNRAFGEQSLLVEHHADDAATDAEDRATILAYPMLRIRTRGMDLAVTGIGAARDIFVRRLKIARLVTCSGRGRLTLQSPQAIWSVLREAQGFFDADGSPEEFTFGLAGYLGYDVSRLIEDLPMTPRAERVPDLDLAVHAVKVTVTGERMSVVVNQIRGLDMPTPEDVLAAVASGDPVDDRLDPDARIRFSMSQKDFEASVRKAKEHIHDGDIYQVQLGHTIEVAAAVDPYAAHERLRASRAAPNNYFLATEKMSVFGASPESFVTLRGNQARMEPIAGTAPRGVSTEEDRAQAVRLVSCRKERAEHIMLVDLCRNDLGRCAEPGSVEVPTYMAVRKYANVLHLVSDVTARVQPATNAWDLIRATFPAGTMTGAPKVRAMEIIEDLEATPRYVYSGAIVLVDVDGFADSFLCIRSVHHTDGRFLMRASAGVVADSDPAAEWAETLHKMATPFKAVTGEELAR